MPDELAKGRDLSAAAHREIWTGLFERADSAVPGIAPTLYERVMDPRAWIPYPDTAADAAGAARARDQDRHRQQRAAGPAADLRRPRPRRSRGRLHALVRGRRRRSLTPRSSFAPARALGTKPEETLMVGDHPVADAGALKAGLRFHLLPPDGAVNRPRGLDRIVAIVDATNVGDEERAHLAARRPDRPSPQSAGRAPPRDAASKTSGSSPTSPTVLRNTRGSPSTQRTARAMSSFVVERLVPGRRRGRTLRLPWAERDRLDRLHRDAALFAERA